MTGERVQPGPGDIAIDAGGETLILMPERSAYWPRERTLFISDTHWGKSNAMRAFGMPIPSGSQSEQLTRLTRAIERTGAVRVLHLGDLVHAKVGITDDLLARVGAWRRDNPIPFGLIRGNHDFRKRGPDIAQALEQWGIEDMGDAATVGPFDLIHDPVAAGPNGLGNPDNPDGSGSGGYRLGGHFHPAVRAGGSAHDKKLPCFWVRTHAMILPAFSMFTAGVGFRLATTDKLFVIAEDRVIEL